MLRSLVFALAASVVTSVTAIAGPVRFAVTDIEGLEALQQRHISIGKVQISNALAVHFDQGGEPGPSAEYRDVRARQFQSQ